MNERLLSVVADCDVLHLGDNLSRHSPIMLKLNIGALPRSPQVQTAQSARRPAWYKASQTDKDIYTLELDRRLSSLTLPESLQCSNPCCNETSHATIPMTGGKPRHHDPTKSCPVWQNIPGWPEYVQPFKEDAVFWHSVWQSAGRPNRGHLYDFMKRTRNQYHYAIRRLKTMSNSLRAKHLLEASEQGSVQLLSEMKRIKGNKKSSEGLYR